MSEGFADVYSTLRTPMQQAIKMAPTPVTLMTYDDLAGLLPNPELAAGDPRKLKATRFKSAPTMGAIPDFPL